MTAPGVARRYINLFRENCGLVQVCVATLISMTGQGIIAPVLPLFAKGFGVSATAIGLVVSIFGLGAAMIFNASCSSPSLYWSSPRRWRRPVVVSMCLGRETTGRHDSDMNSVSGSRESDPR